MRRKASLVLVGASGSGKTTVGNILAERLGLTLVDTDSIVERRGGRSIGEIWDSEGEAAFRKLESEAVVEAASLTEIVVSCGGGAVLDPANIEVLKTVGPVIFLKVSAEVASSRVGDSDDRPLLRGDRLTKISEIINARSWIYEKAADAIVDADRDPEVVAEEIVSIYSEGQK